ncbi:MAG TPA: SDR family NAD(P)-dependent oxidoreductase [Nitrococcus sp.]|nr:SDR family NAD(P)-dependent oxidoreductase [Nitrococcus sp.]
MSATGTEEIPADYYPGADALAGQRVLITGAGAGIGRASALAAARAGATVILLDRHIPPLERVYDEIEAAGDPQPALYPLDLLGAKPEDYVELAQRLTDSLTGLDALVHNAAELGRPCPIAHYHAETWFRTLHINLNAPFMLTQACLPLLERAPHSTVVFISDLAGRCGKPYSGAYGVAKFGLEGLMRTLAAELPNDSPVRSVSYDPGATRTALRALAYPGENPAKLRPPETAARGLIYLLDPKHRIRQGGIFTLAADSKEID